MGVIVGYLQKVVLLDDAACRELANEHFEGPERERNLCGLVLIEPIGARVLPRHENGLRDHRNFPYQSAQFVQEANSGLHLVEVREPLVFGLEDFLPVFFLHELSKRP